MRECIELVPSLRAVSKCSHLIRGSNFAHPESAVGGVAVIPLVVNCAMRHVSTVCLGYRLPVTLSTSSVLKRGIAF